MGMGTLAIDSDQVALILQVREGQYSDMKAKHVSPGKLTKTLAAFANSDGGEIFIGISESSGSFCWDGFADEEDANGHIQAFDQIFPLGDGCHIEFLENSAERGLVLHVVVLRSAVIRRATDGAIYVRRGASSRKIETDAQLRQLERDKGITSFESETVSEEADVITNSETTIEFLLSAFPISEPERWMKMQKVLVGDRPTVAGVVLFADLPQATLPKRCAVKIYRYKTSDLHGRRETLDGQPKTIEGPLYEQIREAVRVTTEIVESIRRLGNSGLSQVRYPPEALHEIITNAVIHRDYGIADDVHIRIFDNRIEVESPGRLPGHVSPENILDERFARNGTIVRLINKFPDPPNKDVGEGLNTAFEAMKALKLKDPEIRELDHSVLVNIRHEKLASPEEMILDYLGTHDEISNRIVRELTGIGSENKVKNIFQHLIKAGEIERVPEKKGSKSAYRLPMGSATDTDSQGRLVSDGD